MFKAASCSPDRPRGFPGGLPVHSRACNPRARARGSLPERLFPLLPLSIHFLASQPHRPSATRDHLLREQSLGQDSLSKLPSRSPLLIGSTSGPWASCTLVPVLEDRAFFPAMSLSSLALCHVPYGPMAKALSAFGATYRVQWQWRSLQLCQARRLRGHVLGPACVLLSFWKQMIRSPEGLGKLAVPRCEVSKVTLSMPSP